MRGVGYPFYDRVCLRFFPLFIVVSKSEVAFFQYKSFLFSIENYQLNVHSLGREKLFKNFSSQLCCWFVASCIKSKFNYVVVTLKSFCCIVSAILLSSSCLRKVFGVRVGKCEIFFKFAAVPVYICLWIQCKTRKQAIKLQRLRMFGHNNTAKLYDSIKLK